MYYVSDHESVEDIVIDLCRIGHHVTSADIPPPSEAPSAEVYRCDMRKWRCDMRQCPGCNVWLAPEQFTRDRTRVSGLSVYCRLCAIERRRRLQGNRRWYAANRERHKQRVIERWIARGRQHARVCPPFVICHYVEEASAARTVCGVGTDRVRYTTNSGEVDCIRCRRTIQIYETCQAADVSA